MLKIKNLSFAYPSRRSELVEVISDISFEANEGSLVLLTGPSGSGKTTLLKLLCGLLKAQSGEVTLDDESVERRATMVFQSPEESLFNATVREEIIFAFKESCYPDVEDRYRDIMSSCGLDHEKYSSRSPLSLSGGEQRRVGLAAMLGLSKKLLLLDEPAVGLDEPGIENVRKIVVSERAAGRIIFIATHNLMDFLDLATHVATLDRGRLKYFVTIDGYILEKVRAEDLELKGKLMVDYYRNFGRFPGDEELLSYWRGEMNC